MPLPSPTVHIDSAFDSAGLQIDTAQVAETLHRDGLQPSGIEDLQIAFAVQPPDWQPNIQGFYPRSEQLAVVFPAQAPSLEALNKALWRVLGYHVDALQPNNRPSKVAAAYGAALGRTAVGIAGYATMERYGIPLAAAGLLGTWALKECAETVLYRPPIEKRLIYRHGRSEHFARTYADNHHNIPLVSAADYSATLRPELVNDGALAGVPPLLTTLRESLVHGSLPRALTTYEDLCEHLGSKVDYLRTRLGFTPRNMPSADALLAFCLEIGTWPDTEDSQPDYSHRYSSYSHPVRSV